MRNAHLREQVLGEHRRSRPSSGNELTFGYDSPRPIDAEPILRQDTLQDARIISCVRLVPFRVEPPYLLFVGTHIVVPPVAGVEPPNASRIWNYTACAAKECATS